MDLLSWYAYHKANSLTCPILPCTRHGASFPSLGWSSLIHRANTAGLRDPLAESTKGGTCRRHWRVTKHVWCDTPIGKTPVERQQTSMSIYKIIIIAVGPENTSCVPWGADLVDAHHQNSSSSSRGQCTRCFCPTSLSLPRGLPHSIYLDY